MTESDSGSVAPLVHAAPEHASREQAATGDVRVDETLAQLDDLDELPVEAHPAVFEQVHRGLAAALGALDSGVEDTSGMSGTRGTSVTPAAPES